MSIDASVPRRKPRFRERHAGQRKPAPPAPPRQRIAPPAPVERREPRAVPLPRITVEQGLWAAIFLAGFVLRIWNVGSRAMHGDESVHAWLAWNLFNGTGYQYDPVYHGPLQFPITALFFFLFGVSNTSGRLMAVLFGAALVFLPWFLRPYMGRAAALVASGLIAVSPAFVYVSRLERDDIFSCFFALTMAIGILGYLRTREGRFVYLVGASAALSVAAMENTYITLFMFGSFLMLVVLSEYIGRYWGPQLVGIWRRTGSASIVTDRFSLACLIAVALAFALTVATGLYAPVPFVVGVLLIAMVNRLILLSDPPGTSGYSHAIRAISRTTWLNTATIVIAILFLTYSTFGTNLRGIWDYTQPILNLSHHDCATSTYLLNPCRKDILGGLFYWLSQHQVARGGQPWFYYSLLYGLYEQMVIVFGVGGILWYWRRPTFFTVFLTYWALLAFGIYSWAGEKFPWLMIHPLMPITLLAAMFAVDLFRRRGIVRYVAVAVFGVLLALEIHSMYEVNYVNGADPVEMMVYVQSSPDTPRVAQSILNISNKVTNGNDLHVTVDALDTWPFAWYLRNMPNVAYPSSAQMVQKPYSSNPVILVDATDQPALYPKVAKNYTGHEYRLRWWFPEDYKSLTWPSFFRDATNPGYWSVIGRWLIDRRPFGPKDAVLFYYYVKNGLASPF